MRINKDLAEALLMLSCIVLVLVGTTDFDSATNKSIIMGILGVLAVLMGIARYISGKNKTQES